MNRGFLLGAAYLALLPMCSALFAQRPVAPAEFESLEITYRLGTGPILTETRTGRIRFNDTPALSAVTCIVVPALNAKGEARISGLVLGGANGSTARIETNVPKRSGDLLVWEIPNAKAGDSVSFVVEQTVDLKGSASAWWFSDAAWIPLPVKTGRVQLQLPAGFPGSLDILDGSHHADGEASTFSWTLDGLPATRRASHFLITSFQNWDEFSAWTAGLCPTQGGARVQDLSGMLANATGPGGKARVAADLVSRQLRVRSNSEGRIGYGCRPVEQILKSGDANPLEAQAVLLALLGAEGVAAEPFLSGAGLGSGHAVNPEMFSRALVRVRDNDRFLWFDAARLPGASGAIAPGAAAESALALEHKPALWITVMPEASLDEGGMVTAKLDASITARGTLQATYELSASGPAGEAYRNAYRPAIGSTDMTGLFAPFLRGLRLRSAPVVSDAYDTDRPFNIEIPIRHDQFLLPIQGQVRLNLNTIPLAEDPKQLADGRFLIGTPGRRREELVLEPPPGYAVRADVHIAENSGFASYRSDAGLDNGRLRITRELDLKIAAIEGSAKADLDALWKVIRGDQEHLFILRRTGAANAREWIELIPAYKANEEGMKAYDQQQYEIARQLLERATQANPKDQYAWNNLGRTLQKLGEWEEARKAFEKQIDVNPKDLYAYNNLGVLLAFEGYWDKAVENYKKQLAANPGDRYATGNLPQTLLQVGQFEEAAEAASKATKTEPSGVLQLYAAIARVCTHGKSNGVAELDAALGALPSAAWLNAAAYHLGECGSDLNAAQRYAERAMDLMDGASGNSTRRDISTAISFQSMYGAYLDTLGWILYKKGETERAAALIAAASGLAQVPEELAHLATALWKLGQTEEAVRWGQEAVFLGPGFRSALPPQLTSQIGKGPGVSVDGVWYPVTLTNSMSLAAATDRPLYYFVVAGSGGEIESIRALDAGDELAQAALDGLRKLRIPSASVQGRSVRTAQFLKLVRGADGKATLYRSVSARAIALAAELAPDEFPQAQPAEN